MYSQTSKDLPHLQFKLAGMGMVEKEHMVGLLTQLSSYKNLFLSKGVKVCKWVYVRQRTDKEAKAVVERTGGTEQQFQKLRHLGTVQRVGEDGKTCTQKKNTTKLFTNL